MKVDINLESKDLYICSKYFLTKPPYRRGILTNILLTVILTIILSFFLGSSGWITLLAVGIALGIIWLRVLYNTKSLTRKIYANTEGFLGHHTITIDEQGIKESTSVNETFQSWKGIYNVEETTNYIYILLNPSQSHVIPKRDFHSLEQADSFFQKAYAFWQTAKNNSSSDASSAG